MREKAPNKSRRTSQKLPQPAKSGSEECDKLDRQLIQSLVRDVRATNRQLAAAAGVSVWKVANRLKRLRERGFLAATLFVDWRLAGYRVSALVFLKVKPSSVAKIAEEIAQRPYIQSLVSTIGPVNLISHVLGRDLNDIRNIVDEISAHPDIVGVETLPAVDYHHMLFDRTALPIARWSPDNLDHPDLPLDDLDRRLMRCLIDDAHQSNREIAKQLAVSENAIRIRIRRLEDSGLARVKAVFDPFAMGEAVLSYFALCCRGGTRTSVAEQLSHRKSIPVIISCLGQHDLVGLTISRSSNETLRMMDTIQGIEGVKSLVHFPILNTHISRLHLTHLN